MSPDRISPNHALAIEHVRRGRRIVERQRELIRTIRDQGRDCTGAEKLLLLFQQSLVIFEDDLRQIAR